ncbi:hypothetical protein H310_07624 [Aphanomyces invadans]|uniref:DNA polymerase alpha subunit B n=1 Tax=Aphanomyces invadans TaxID=157072 RepID=A0A024U3N3_9STRA|nr:hypothetical protein H310_07624 [Aphanomyces invadans]ETW00233.1 hypothetical protein H310_07624 [Aphanomyces invadans]|eukprot:XP_008871258.1 hypothetical protein H310_07624 [Aphanomyces invadans]
MSTTTAADINAAFNNNSLDIKEDAVATCIDLCKEFALSAESLAEQWDVFAMNASIKVATVDSLGKFRAMLFDQANKRSIKRETKETLKSKPMVKKEPIASVYGIQLPTVHDTPKKRQASASFQSPDAKILRTSVFSPSSFQSPPTAEYASRTNAGEVVDSFNTSLKSQIEPAEYRSDSVEVERLHGDKQMSPSANFMYTSMSDRAIALDTLLVDFQTRMEAQLGIEFGAVGDPSPSQVTVCGRIVCEAPEGKLNASVIQLEGARKHCGGQRVLLDLSQVPALEAFPGKLVAVEGIYNDTRNPMQVKRFIEPEPLAMVESIANDSAPIRVFTAAGPFTANNDPQYQPLSDLIKVAAKQRPDVVILMGPFIDANHAKDGIVSYDNVLVSFDDIFLFQIITKFNTLLAELPNCHLVLIPSVRDVQHPYVYPQPPFDRKKVFEGLDSPDFQKRVHLLSNPTTFTINGTVFGATTSDILLELGGAEFHRSQQAAQQQRLFRLTEQLLRQNSFFPLFPSTGDTPLDLKYIDQYQLPVRPDVLLLPSVLNRFCGAVQDTLCVNPGQLSKGQAGGTYAEITILPKGHHESPEPHQVAQRTLVEVKRI